MFVFVFSKMVGMVPLMNNLMKSDVYSLLKIISHCISYRYTDNVPIRYFTGMMRNVTDVARTIR